MAITIFKDSSYSLSTLIEEIDRGEIALPDIQRPFVWKPTKVRDLFDSMYRGFPVGNLLFWATGAEVGARRIGTHSHQAAPRLMIVDGQQRLTSLYSVLTGKSVLRKDYTDSRIRIGFRPRDGSFQVTNVAVEKNPEYIPDISIIWGSEGRRKSVRAFFKRLEESKGTLEQDFRDELEESIDRLYDLHNYPFKVFELGAGVDEEQVADVFVRINSKGVLLGQAEFVLTLMSVYWDEGRKELEAFARDCKLSHSKPSPANPFIDPTADQMLRVVAGLGLRRGRLKYVYQMLRGKDLETGKLSAEIRDLQFAQLQKAQRDTLSLTNWHGFLSSVRSAGYLSKEMISSQNNLIFSYLVYLVAHHEHGLDHTTLRSTIAQWFFMTSLTGRYTGSFESQVEQDLHQFALAKSGDDLITLLNGITDTALTKDFWSIQLPNWLKTSSADGPKVSAYHASLVLLNSQPLFSSLGLRDVLDPSIHAPKSSVKRDHLFPKKYLNQMGINQIVHRNQIANYAFVEWPNDLKTHGLSPREYFPALFDKLSPHQQDQARFWHALPIGWENLDYWDFLEQRRILIARVIQTAFTKLRMGQMPPKPNPIFVEDLLKKVENDQIEFKSSAYYSYNPNVPEKVVKDSFLKTVAGFLNTHGGTLGVGIADNREVLGIQPDLDKKNMDIDRYVNSLTNMIQHSLGSLAATRVNIQVQTTNNIPVAVVTIYPSPVPIYAKVSTGNQIFYIRMNNSTRKLEGEDLVEYIKQNWK